MKCFTRREPRDKARFLKSAFEVNWNLERLEQLARLTDVSDLPLCDLISRASYLEEQHFQKESTNKKPSPSLKSEAQPSLSSVLAPQVTVRH